MRYYVTFRVDATYTAMVFADSAEKAIEFAEEELFAYTDLGDLDNIENEVIFIEDENGEEY